MTERIMENGCKEVNQNFYRKLLIVGIPMIIQQVIAVTLNLADTIWRTASPQSMIRTSA